MMDFRKAAFTVFMAAAWFTIGWKSSDLLNTSPPLVQEAEAMIRQKHYGAPLTSNLQHLAIRGMVHGIGDIRANFYPPEVASRFQRMSQGDYGVIGIRAETADGAMTILEAVSGGPASEAGLRSGDRIVRIDGQPIPKDATDGETAVRIIGDDGTAVTLTVERQDQTLEYKVVRRHFDPVDSRMVDPTTAYLQLRAFPSEAVAQTREALQTLLAQKPKRLILDLRDNTGGQLDAAAKIINLFIGQGPIVTAKYQDKGEFTYMAKPEELLLPQEVEMIVLVNHASMSAAEVTTSALKETGRALVIGETTYGKGTINSTYPLSDGSMLELTDGGWFSPLKKSYHKTGVTPDILVPDARDADPAIPDPVLDAALQRLLTR